MPPFIQFTRVPSSLLTKFTTYCSIFHDPNCFYNSFLLYCLESLLLLFISYANIFIKRYLPGNTPRYASFFPWTSVINIHYFLINRHISPSPPKLITLILKKKKTWVSPLKLKKHMSCHNTLVLSTKRCQCYTILTVQVLLIKF